MQFSTLKLFLGQETIFELISSKIIEKHIDWTSQTASLEVKESKRAQPPKSLKDITHYIFR